MFKEEIAYKDYDGNDRKTVAYFNLSEAELTDWQLSEEGGLSEQLQRIIDSNDGAQIMKTFKKVLKKAYGVKSPDGNRLIKNKKLYKEFTETEAYNQLFMELCTDANKAAEFINNVIPSEERMKGFLTKKA